MPVAGQWCNKWVAKPFFTLCGLVNFVFWHKQGECWINVYACSREILIFLFKLWISSSGLFQSRKQMASSAHRCVSPSVLLVLTQQCFYPVAIYTETFEVFTFLKKNCFGVWWQRDRAIITYAFIFVLIGTIAGPPRRLLPSCARGGMGLFISAVPLLFLLSHLKELKKITHTS